MWTAHVDVPGLLNELRELHLFCVCCPFPTLDGRQAMKMMTWLLNHLYTSFLLTSCMLAWLLPCNTNIFHCEQIELSRAEVESLRTEIADAEERESHLKARYEIQRKNVVVCSLLKSGHILFFRKKKVEICWWYYSHFFCFDLLGWKILMKF